MNQETFDNAARQLRVNIGSDIAYIFSSFVPEDTKNKLLKLKCDILPADRPLLLNPAAAGNRFLCPYDVLTTRITRRIEDFYTDITFSAQTYTKLSRYGKRAEPFKAYFQKNLKASMQNTQRTLLRELDLQIMQNRTPKQITAYLNTILDRRMRNLRQLLQSSAGQMEQFMILWEYQDCGFNRYRYVAVGTTCEGCTALDGQIFLIDEAEPGVNFGTLHPHCDCKTEILDANGNAVYTISSVKKEEKQEKSSSWMSAFTMAAQAVKQNAADIWSALEKHFSSPLAFLDWLTMGALSDNARRGQIAKDDPTLYNIGNWLTMGTFDMVKGAVKPEKPFSLEHWLDSLGTVLLGLDVAKLGGSLLPQVKSALNPSKAISASKKAIDYADDAAKAAAKHVDDAADAAKAATKEGKALQNAADALIDGKVAGKIPLEEYEAIRKRSVKNAASDTLTLGKYAADETSYTVRAGKTSYFDLGDEWNTVIDKYDITTDDMFDLFNKPVLEEALEQGKTIRFSHNPLLEDGFLKQEWSYIKNVTDLDDTNLVFEGEFWYVRK